MRLLKLSLINFKGKKNFTLKADCENINVFGDNETGKTTLFDAFLWLLFDKDSTGKKDFAIKTLDADNNVIQGLNHEVEGVFELNGKQLTLLKVYAEKWTKKRGSATSEFTGHTTDHFIDGVPVSKGEYQAKIAEIADESIFKLLTSPSYFNEQLHWQDRRKILLEVCGDISDQEVIASDKKLAKLTTILGDRTLENHKKVIAAKKAEINKELEKLPVRIDETMRSLPDITNLVPEKLAEDIAKIQSLVKEKRQEIVRVENGGEVVEKRKQLAEIDGELLRIKNNHRSMFDGLIVEKQKLLSEAREKFADLRADIRNYKNSFIQNVHMISDLETRLAQLRSKWEQVNAESFNYEKDDACPTCGQALPVEKLEEARNKAMAKFNQTKAEELEKIRTEGKYNKAEVEKLKDESADNQKNIEASEKNLASVEETATNFQSEITNLQGQSENYTQSPTYIQKLNEKENINKAIADLQTGSQETVSKLQGEIIELETSIGTLRQAQAKVEQRKQGEVRINELKVQERELAAEYEKLEGELYLAEEFIRTKVAMLEQKINSKFKMARFKLFETQVNGGLNEVCETLYKGVPYGSGLNNAAKINVGLDIINTLAEHYNFTTPIFVDNAEAVTKLIDTKGQLIKLVVSAKDKNLRVENK